MSEWISRQEKEPSMPDPVIRFDSVAYLVTDGEQVGVADFARGHGGGKPWASWSMYGDISPAKITHWMPLPEPPKD